MGIGIGMIFTSIILFGFNNNTKLSDSEIEEKARALGMHYSDECKVLFKGDEKVD